jgi:hypothetical protein
VANIRLKYKFSTLPSLADRNGEVVSNWVTGGTHVVSASATHAYSGMKSLQIAASGTGDFTTNYASLASGNNSAFVVGKKYSINIWVYAASALTFQIKTGGVSSATFTCVPSVWTKFPFLFTAGMAVTALQIAVTTGGGGTIWFELEEFKQYTDIPVLSIKGLVAADWVQFFPSIINKALDGNSESQFMSFIRQIKVDCAPINNGSEEEKAILYWHLDNKRKVDYGTETDIDWTPQNADGYELIWMDDFFETKKWQEDFTESIARTTFPV